MGTRQSFPTDFDRQPRSNSTAESTVEVHENSNRRSIPHYRHQSNAYDLDEHNNENSGMFSALSNLGILSSRLSQSLTSSQPNDVINRNENCSINNNSNSNNNNNNNNETTLPASSYQRNRLSNSSQNSNSNGLRFSFRSSNRTSLFQALTNPSINPSTNLSANGRDRHAVPFFHVIGRDLKCPMCHKRVLSDDVEVHLVMCFTRPRIAYNDEVLESNKGECSICLDDMCSGDTIARLPCLCIYHKNCIDEWFLRKNFCPEHPGND